MRAASIVSDPRLVQKAFSGTRGVRTAPWGAIGGAVDCRFSVSAGTARSLRTRLVYTAGVGRSPDIGTVARVLLQ